MIVSTQSTLHDRDEIGSRICRVDAVQAPRQVKSDPRTLKGART